MAAARSPHPTLEEMLKGVVARPHHATSGGGAYLGRGGVSVVDGLTPKRFIHREGVQRFAPEQLLHIRVPVQRIRDGEIRGYQRVLKSWKARKIATWMVDNVEDERYLREMQIIEVSIDGNGNAFFTDGQHRAAGAVIARLPVDVRMVRRTEEEARRLFANQGKATRPSRNVLIFDGEDPYSLYIQDAVTSLAGTGHPWTSLISASQASSSQTRMSATAAYGMLAIYVGRNRETVAQVSRNGAIPFDKEAADQLGVLVSVFGTRKTNPLAYSSVSLRGIALAAAAVFRNEEKPPKMPDDFERWLRHMPQFSFNSYAYIKTSTDMADRLIAHWNRKMPEDRKVIL